MFSSLRSEDPIVKWNILPILDLSTGAVLPGYSSFVVLAAISAGLPLGRSTTVAEEEVPKGAPQRTGGGYPPR